MVTIRLDWMEVATIWELIKRELERGVPDKLAREVLEDLSDKFMNDVEDFEEIIAT